MTAVAERVGRGEQRGGLPLGAKTLILAGILLIAGCLRFTGLNWDEGQYIHPDEGHMRNTLSIIRWPDDLTLYFDTHQSPLNVRNHGGHRYSYGTLPLFVVRGAAEWLDGACTEGGAPLRRMVARALVGDGVEGCGAGAFSGTYGAVVGRAVSSLCDLGTLLLIYLTAKKLYGDTVGLLAAGLGAVTAFMIQQAHFFTVDSMACFFTTAVAYLSVRAARSGQWLDFAGAGVAVGLAAACKVSAATAALLVALAAVTRFTEKGNRGTARQALRLTGFLVLAGILSLVAFRVGQPYAFEGPGFFGVRPSAEWFGRLSQIRAEQSGDVDLPSGRQWANRMPIVFPWLNMVVWGAGIPLGLAGWIGWGVSGLQLLGRARRGRRHLVLWGWFTVVFLYHATQWVKAMRYFLALYPALVIFAAWLLSVCARKRTRAGEACPREVAEAGEHVQAREGGKEAGGPGWAGGAREVTSPSRPQRWRWAGVCLAGIVVVGAVLWGIAFFTIYLRPHPRLAASRWIYENVPAGSTVANEHWDWGLPLRIDGHDPFGDVYTGIEMQNYNEDTVQKRQRLYGWLDEADWIFLASNRLYASIPRLPTRYPLTTEYYRALFAGELGFELAADFTSYPALGPLVFPDQENPFPLMEADYVGQRGAVEMRLPPAEEAFSVYDHPRVLLFRKTEAYSSELARSVLGKVDLSRVQQGRAPREATKAPRLLQYDEEAWADQRAGGTWSEMFNRDGLLNRYPGLAALAWWGAVTALGMLAFPLLFVSLPGLQDRGYGFARLAGLLLIGYLTWMAASLRLFPNTRGTITRMVALLAVAGGGLGWLKRRQIEAFLRERWRTLVLIEVLFGALFAVWLGVRMLQPDLWHPVVGGEKPMDFAYLNAVMKSTWFPPYNPWLSGTWINYYYFGFVIVGTLIKLMGTVPSIAYNLAVPLLFALTGVGAFSVAYNLHGALRRGSRRRRADAAGILGTVFVVLMGNLGVVHLMRSKLMALGEVSFASTIPGFPGAVSLLHGLWRVGVEGASLSLRPETWYWHPTRIIPDGAGNAIAEFPAFTFLYGDLHAHMIAFPLTLFAVIVALSWATTARRRWWSLLLGALVVGSLRPTNTWDYPTYLLLGIGGLALGAWVGGRTEAGERGWGKVAGRAVGEVAAVVGLTLLLYVPYGRHYVAGYSSFRLWEGGRTPVGIYLWIYAGLLFPTVTWMVLEVIRRARHGGIPHWAAAVAGAGAVLVGAAAWAMKVPVALVALPVGALAMLLFLTATGDGGAETRAEGLLWLAVTGAMVLSMAVEIVVLKGDIGRMNTVFKFYLQVWVLLAIAAGVSLVRLWHQARRWQGSWQRLWWGGMAALTVGGALFLPSGIRARAVDRMAPEAGLTLDGMAFMEHAAIHDGPEGDLQEIALAGDYEAIRWMQDHVQGSSVILEGLGRREYLWANRVSVYTGLPAVVGWRWHEVQQRAGVGGDMVAWRRADVDACYSTEDVVEAREILERYDVSYVYVGGYERAYYKDAGLDKFDRMAEQGLLRTVYDAAGTQIYEVLD